MRIVLAGAVTSSKTALQCLIRHEMEVVGVLGHEPSSTASVSGYSRLDGVAEDAGIPYLGFKKINSPAVEEQLLAWSPDVLFVVGLSQLVRGPLLDIARFGCVGFHPTRLPEGRGRAPIAWIVLDRCPAAATFFLMGEGADDGPLFVQEPFEVDETDDSSSVLAKTLEAMVSALDRWLPELKRGVWSSTPQDEDCATWYGVRRPEDGAICWDDSAQSVARLVRSATRPHPGAYAYWRNHKVTIWKCRLEEELPIKGVAGRILRRSSDNHLLVQTGDGLLWLEDYELTGVSQDVLRVGQKLWRGPDPMVALLQSRVEELERRLAE